MTYRLFAMCLVNDIVVMVDSFTTDICRRFMKLFMPRWIISSVNGAISWRMAVFSVLIMSTCIYKPCST